MCLLVKTDQEFLVDVGFGDLFMRPVGLNKKMQFDGRGHFCIEATAGGNYEISTRMERFSGRNTGSEWIQ
jgi:N-hydroxyarylamine O-acetyltransferase